MMREKIVLAVVCAIVAVGMVSGCKVEQLDPPAPSTWTGTSGTLNPDTTPPTVQSSSPTSGATNVSTTAIISATFSESISPSTVNVGTFTLNDGATNVAGIVSLIGTTATFSPSSALLYGTTYTATITTGVTDLAGNQLAANYSWTFTTTAATDTTPPTVVSVTPSNGATNVSIHATIYTVFSESILFSSVTGSTFLVSTGGTPVPGQLSLMGGATLRFSPYETPAPLPGDPTALSSATTYSVTVTTGVQDAAGNALAAPYSGTFTTAPAPSITTTNLADGTETGAYSQTLVATGGYQRLYWSATGLPAWLTVDTLTGNLSGTPPLGSATSSPYTFNVTVMDNDGLTATQSLSLNVITGPVISTSTLPDGTTTGVYTAPILTAAGGTLPYNWSATGLPSGLSLSSAGDLTGTITAAAGSYPINVTLTDNVGVIATRGLTLVVNAVPSITTASPLTAWMSGATASVTFAATDGTTPLTWTSTPSPPDTWLTLTSAGVLSGTEPGNAAGTTHTFDITVTDVNGVSATQTFNLVIQ